MTVIIILLLTLITCIFCDTNYCNLESCNGEPHTMCIYPTMKPGKYCGLLDNYELSFDEKKNLLHAHNKYRAIVANGTSLKGINETQPAGIIPPLKWDKELALLAQRWAIQCEYKYDKCRDTASYTIGQNIAIKISKAGYLTSMISLVEKWYNEGIKIQPRLIKKYKPRRKTDGYTQLIWAKTTHVGCGIAKYCHDQNYSSYLVCNYRPAGNWIGEPVYKIINN